MNQAAGPYLEILESVTRMPPIVDLTAVEHRLGRSPAQSDIVFENDITVSRLHASIVLEESGYTLYDEGSTSGTWLNEQAVTQRGQSLRDGDEIRLGAAVMRFRLP
jgi:pSer/pThr/pTyr-binding forkhead associated (FHA) protein